MKMLLRKFLIAIFALFIAMPAFAPDNTVDTSGQTTASVQQTQTDRDLTDMGNSGDIGDFGRWATRHNQQLVIHNLTRDLQSFAPTATPIEGSFVPIEAKIGLAFIGGLTHIGVPLDRSLTRFAELFMLLAYAFWVAFEAYNLITAKSVTQDSIKKIVIKGLIIAGWVLVLNYGIVNLFATIMIPIVELGTYISHTIWQGITGVAGYDIVVDTCEAIRNYAATNIADLVPNVENETFSSGLVDSLKNASNSTAGLLCIPSQLSAFFVTAIEIGWNLLLESVGVSLLTAFIGGYITYLGLKCILKFLFFALGVVADIFLGLLLLPFTAVAETIAKTDYKGVAGDIFNSFLEIFKGEKLETQINRIIQAVLYFICLGISVGVSVGLLSFIIDLDTKSVSSAMRVDGLNGLIILILSLLLVCYMAQKAQSLAESWCEKMDTSFGDKVKQNVLHFWTVTKNNWKKIRALGKKK